MRILVTGASGNVGTALLRRLRKTGEHDLAGLSRRAPDATPPYDGVEWFTADLRDPASAEKLPAAVAGADCVVHLAWQLQPGRDPQQTWAANVEGTKRVVAAAVTAGVPHLLHTSSVGAYSPGPESHEPVDESWPTGGVDSSNYSREKAEIEGWLRDTAPALDLALVRPGLIMQTEAGSAIGRYFLGPLWPPASLAIRAGRRFGVPALPLPRGLVFQAVHSDDVADAMARIVEQRATGAFNLGADPLDVRGLGELAGARPLPLPAAVFRGLAAGAYAVHLSPTQPGWFDLAMEVPVMSADRARTELGWAPAHTSGEALAALFRGMAEKSGEEASPVLRPAQR